MAKKRRKKVRLRKRVYGLLIIILVLLVSVYFGLNKIFDDKAKTTYMSANFNQSERITLYLYNNLHSESVYVYDIENDRVVYESDSEEQLALASITKVMTVLLACEYYQDYDAKVTVASAIFPYIWETHASVAGFSAGEEVTVNDLLYGAILPSGADATIMLAYDIAGSEDAFVKLMNQKANELGLVNTNFTNSTGLDEGDIHSTASDIAKLVKAALENEKFREVYTSSAYTTSSTAYNPSGIELVSGTYQYFDKTSGNYQFLGSKSGYTDLAKQCLSSLVEIDGKEYIVVTLGADGDYSKKEYYSYDDAKYIYEILSKCIK